MIRHSVSQFPILRRDRWLLSSLTWLPILIAVMIWAIFSQGIARELPIGVVNLDSSKLSQRLIRYYDATSSMKVAEQFSSAYQAKQALVNGDIYAYAVIPYNFEQDTYKQLSPQVSVFYNSQMILVGKVLSSAFLHAQGTLNAQLSTIGNLSHGNTSLIAAMGNAVPIRSQVTPLFNKNSNYAQFLVSSLVPAIWQIVVVVTTILILSANVRDRGLKQWLGDRPIKAIIQTLTPYSWVFSLQGFAFLCWFYLGFKWPMNGSFLVLIFAQWVTVVAFMIMATLFFFLTLDAARGMSFAAAFTAPSFAFMGVTFPTSDMGILAQTWRNLLPISHYIEVQINQVSYGQFWLDSLAHLIPMIGYIVPALLVVVLVNKHLKTLPSDPNNEDVS